MWSIVYAINSSSSMHDTGTSEHSLLLLSSAKFLLLAEPSLPRQFACRKYSTVYHTLERVILITIIRL